MDIKERRLKDFHEQMIKKQGALVTVDKTIQELMELVEQLRNWKTAYINKPDAPKHEFIDIFDNIQEERVDVSVMLQRLDRLFYFTKQENKNIGVEKINRTIERYLL